MPLRHRTKKYPPTKEQIKKYNLANRLRLLYGITIAQYEALSLAQGGRCAVCNEAETVIHHRNGQVKRLAVDHCHNTGVIRGLLCMRCNQVLGACRDSPELLRKMATYAETAKASIVKESQQGDALLKELLENGN